MSLPMRQFFAGAFSGRPGSARGFTIVEMMIVVALVGLVASVAYPKFSNLIRKSKDAASIGALSKVRAAISLYYSDNEGLYPYMDSTQSGLVPKYVPFMPTVEIPADGHMLGNSVGNVVADFATAWYYDQSVGEVAVNCTHPDAKGVVWSTY